MDGGDHCPRRVVVRLRHGGGVRCPPLLEGQLPPLSAITDAGTFFLFGFLSLVTVIYFWRRVPETKGLRLEDIGAQIEGRRLTPGAMASKT